MHWDKEVERLRVKPRLQELPLEGLYAFCASVFEHAADVVTVDPTWKNSQPALAAVRKGINGIWQLAERGAALEGEFQTVADELARLAPDEDDTCAKGEDDLLTGVGALCRHVAKVSADRALDSASYAYQAVTDYALGVVNGAEEDFRRAEQSSGVCLAEIEYQQTLVHGLSQIEDGDFSRETVAAKTATPAPE